MRKLGIESSRSYRSRAVLQEPHASPPLFATANVTGVQLGALRLSRTRKEFAGNAMTHDAPQKVKASHLKRNAYLYIRQCTLRQVIENTESTQRQYALCQNAAALGWPLDRIIVIDTDLGQSGASAAAPDHRDRCRRTACGAGAGAGKSQSAKPITVK